MKAIDSTSSRNIKFVNEESQLIHSVCYKYSKPNMRRFFNNPTYSFLFLITPCSEFVKKSMIEKDLRWNQCYSEFR